MKPTLIGGLASSKSTLVQKELQKFNCGYDSDPDSDQDGDAVVSLLLTLHANGTTSEVFRASPPSLSAGGQNSSKEDQEVIDIISQTGGIEEWICLKRVVIQGQPKPHDVVREIRCLLKINRKHENIIPLLAAFYDESEPFSTKYDLVFPLYPINLSQLLDEPTFLPQLSPSTSTPTLSLSNASYVVDPISTSKEVAGRLNRENFIPYVKSIYQQLLSALSFLHDECSISHRDVKPSNILLSLDGKPRLTDFGTVWETNNIHQAEDGWLKNGRIGDDGEGSILPDVGSGSFRPPELLLSPKNGYDSTKVDIWELGVTISSFFTEVIESRNSSGLGGAFDGEEDESLEYQDGNYGQTEDSDIPEWEKELFRGDSDERTKGPQEFRSQDDDEDEDLDLKANWLDQRERDEEDQFEPRMRSHRSTLFDGSRGDIGLMGSIFNIRGLSKDEKDWPEAVHFQPSLSSFPFETRPQTNLLDHLPLAKRVLSPSSPKLDAESKDQIKELQTILIVVEASLQLSASKRPSAKEALKLLLESTN